MKTFISKVKGFEGECTPTFLNTHQIEKRIFGAYTGFFKLVKKGWFGIRYKAGKEFHGYIASDRTIRTTDGIYNSSQLK